MSERLRHSSDVQAVLAHGSTVRGAHAVVRSLPRSEAGGPRWTVSASRRVGTAVDRNRAKRRLRAVMRQLELPTQTDFVVIARASSIGCLFAELQRDVAAAIDGAGRGSQTEAMP